MKYKQPRYTGQTSKRKFLGFKYYLHSNDKLTRKEREDVLNRSKSCLNEVSKSLPFKSDEFSQNGLISELDNNLSDIELIDQWNFMYETYGYLMSEFRDQWEKEKIKDLKHSPFKLSNEFEELQERVRVLENEVMRLKVQLIKKRNNYSDMG